MYIAVLYFHTVAEHTEVQRCDAAEFTECEFVLELEFVSVHLHEVGVAIDILHLGEFGCPLASRGNDTVAHEVALEAFVAEVALGVVVA